MKAYNSLLWGGYAQFQQRSPEKWYYTDANDRKTPGGHFKSSGNLTLVTIDEAGHMSPHDQPKAASDVMRLWTGRTRNGSEIYPAGLRHVPPQV